MPSGQINDPLGKILFPYFPLKNSLVSVSCFASRSLHESAYCQVCRVRRGGPRTLSITFDACELEENMLVLDVPNIEVPGPPFTTPLVCSSVTYLPLPAKVNLQFEKQSRRPVL